MEFANFSPQQRQALLDLLVLGMYADGHLGSAEDDRLQGLLTTMGFDTEYDRNRQLDESVTRVRRYSQTADAARTHAAELAQSFTSPEQRRKVSDLLDDFFSSNSQVAPAESQFLSAVRSMLKV